MEICKSNHRYDEKFKDLPDSQAIDKGRHLCCGCAYEKGYEDAKKGLPENFDKNEIKESQAGTIRHKDAQKAYELGYKDRIKDL